MNLNFSPIIFCLLLMVSCGNERANSKVDKQETAKSSVKSKSVENSETTIKQSAEKTDPTQLAKAKEIINKVSAEQISSIDAKNKFKTNCSLCHGIKGNMMVNGAKDLTKSTIDLTESVAQIYHGKGLMTPFKGVLTDVEIVAVAQYCESLRN